MYGKKLGSATFRAETNVKRESRVPKGENRANGLVNLVQEELGMNRIPLDSPFNVRFAVTMVA